eukprot:TRINITY_DN5760_c0_g1_i1.p1 TRINITY_DN5760_c0_g1~~TRINITY_DN5760_c0_g1_i1.p1  ORF type:complete len:323 (-),score=56.71 TRINITY_DN5760_c0_g1_i1:75-1019(-)
MNTQCMICQKEFGPFTYRHQCGKCLNDLCDDCCPIRNEKRICISCFTQSFELYQLTKNVIEERMELLKLTAPPNFIDLQIEQSITNVRNATEKILELPVESARFLSNLVIAASRAWEAFKTHLISKEPCFPNVSLRNIKKSIHEDASTVSHCSIQSELRITPLSMEYDNLKRDVQLKILQQFQVVQEIVPGITTEELKMFLEEVQFLVFNVNINLYGLSSCDGSKVYLSEYILYDPEIARRTLEHELMYSISRWDDSRKNCLNPRKISPEKNLYLRSQSGIMVEAGDYYEEKVYGTKSPESPFCLVVPKWRGYF